MAQQIFTIATIGGAAGKIIKDTFRKWCATAVKPEEDDLGFCPSLDAFCEKLHDHRADHSILYYAEWMAG